MAGEEILQSQGDQPNLPAGLTPGGLPQQATPNVNVDEDKDVDVDQISAQFLKHWLQRTLPAPGEEGPAPGSFGGKLQNAISQVSKGLGDAGAATATPLTPGEPPALAGITRTLQARNERMKGEREEARKVYEQRQQSAVNTLTMASMVERIKKSSQEARDAADTRGKDWADRREKAGHDRVTGLTEDQARAEMAGYKDSQDRHYGEVYDLVPTGHTTVNGKSMRTFDRITKEGRSVEVSPEEAAAWKVDGLTAGTKIPYEAAQSYHNAAMVREQNDLALKTAYGAAAMQGLRNAGTDAQTNQHVQKGIMQNPSDPISGLQTESDHIDAMIDQFQIMGKELDKAGIPPGVAQVGKDELQGHLAELQKGKSAIETYLTVNTTKEMMETNRKINEDSDKYDLGLKKLDVQRQSAKMKQAALSGNEDDMRSAAGDLVTGLGDPSQLPKRGKNFETILRYAKEYSQKNFGVDYDWAQAQTDFHYANQRGTKDTLGMVRSVTENRGSLEIAESASATLPQLNSDLINRVFNKVAGSFGDERITNFQTALLGLADEYAKVMGGGVASDTARQQALDLLKDGYSKGQFKGAFDIIRKDLDARARGIIGKNRYLWKEYGEDFKMGGWDPKTAVGRGPIMPSSMDGAKNGTPGATYKKVEGEQGNLDAAKASTAAASAQNAAASAAAATPAEPSKAIPGSFNRPADLPTAVGAVPDKKGNMWFYDAQRKPLRMAKPGEIPEEKK